MTCCRRLGVRMCRIAGWMSTCARTAPSHRANTPIRTIRASFSPPSPLPMRNVRSKLEADMPETLALEQRALALPDQARSLLVCDDTTYQQAGVLFLRIKTLRKEVVATFDPIIAKAHATHKEACAQKKRHDEPLALAESVVEGRMTAYRTQQARITAEAQRKAQEAATLQEAIDAESRGDTLAAEQALNGQGVVAGPATPPTPAVEGVSFSDHWIPEIVAEALIPREFLMVDMV